MRAIAADLGRELALEQVDPAPLDEATPSGASSAPSSTRLTAAN